MSELISRAGLRESGRPVAQQWAASGGAGRASQRPTRCGSVRRADRLRATAVGRVYPPGKHRQGIRPAQDRETVRLRPRGPSSPAERTRPGTAADSADRLPTLRRRRLPDRRHGDELGLPRRPVQPAAGSAYRGHPGLRDLGRAVLLHQVNLGPAAERGSDALLLPLPDGSYEVRSSPIPASRCFPAGCRPVTRRPTRRSAPSRQSTSLMSSTSRQGFDSPIWAEAGLRCVGCGSCTYTCPTCHCFDIVDEPHGAAAAGCATGTPASSPGSPRTPPGTTRAETKPRGNANACHAQVRDLSREIRRLPVYRLWQLLPQLPGEPRGTECPAGGGCPPDGGGGLT